jgi:hypothetical protein
MMLSDAIAAEHADMPRRRGAACCTGIVGAHGCAPTVRQAFLPVVLFLIVACFALTARAEDLTLQSTGLPPTATVTAFSGVAAAIPAVRDGDAFKWRSLAPGIWNVEILSGKTDVIGVDMKLRDLQGHVTDLAPLPETDAASIRDFFAHTEDFFTHRRMPLLLGSGNRAVALIENIQEAATTSMPLPPGKTFFRLDLWDFENAHGSWQKVKSRVFLRRIVDKDRIESMTFVYSTALGGIDIKPREPVTVLFAFPASSDADKEKK